MDFAETKAANATAIYHTEETKLTKSIVFATISSLEDELFNLHSAVASLQDKLDGVLCPEVHAKGESPSEDYPTTSHLTRRVLDNIGMVREIRSIVDNIYSRLEL